MPALVLTVALSFAFAGYATAPALANGKAVNVSKVRVPWPSVMFKHSAQRSAATSATRSTPAPVEVPSLRTATSRTYDLGDGRLQAITWTTPVNYLDNGGAWQPIDNSLVATGNGWTNKAGLYSVALPGNLAAPVKFSVGSQWATLALSGASAAGSTSANTVSYANALPGVTVRYAAANDRVKESIDLASASAASTFTFTVATSAGLSATATPDGGVAVSTAGGTRAFTLPAPFMMDASGALSKAVTLRASSQSGALTLTLAADRSWITDPARTFPVTIDPTVSLSGAGVTTDCFIQSLHPDTNYCTNSSQLTVGDNTTSGAWRGLLRFNVPTTIPKDSIVLDADLALYQQSQSGSASGGSLELHQLAQNFTDGATWNSNDGPPANDPWTTPGGTFTPAVQYSTAVGTATGWYHWNALKLGQAWVGGAPNQGFELLRTGESTPDLHTFVPSDSPDTAHLPAFSLVYAQQVGERGFYSTVDRTLNDRMHVHANIASGDLVLHADDVQVKGSGIDLSLSRFYNSALQYPRSLGQGWSMSGLDTRLDFDPDGSIEYTGASGFRVPYLKTGSTSWQLPSGMDADLARDSQNASIYTLTFRHSGEVQTFFSSSSAGAQLLSDADRDGNKITYHRDASGNVDTITDSHGRALSLLYGTAGCAAPAGALCKVTDWTGRTWNYGYDGAGNLITYTDPAAILTHYAYDQYGNLSKVTSPGNNVTTFAYNGGRVTSITQVTSTPPTLTGPTTTFSYAFGASCPDGGSCTVVTDPKGGQTTYQWNNQDQVTKVTDPLGNAQSASYSPDDQVAQTLDAANSQTTFSWDPNTGKEGNLNAAQSATGAQTSYTYDAAGQSFSRLGMSPTPRATRPPTPIPPPVTWPPRTPAAPR